ncbi:hypothetical protein KUL156_10780 [Alteromonas sp. KUL156]|nr:hypothetical protein KUL154_42940 [Alteromonas sp. KUL154]GFD98485.1 hypothetical protein KUL156_10780 [Alteromonas sp. KUL156]
MVHMVLLRDGKFEASAPFGNINEQKQIVTSAIAEAATSGKPLVLHFHGGLVNRANGMAIANSLNPIYRDANGVPLFFVWQTGLVETIRANYQEALKGRLIKWAIKRLLNRVKPKVIDSVGFRSTSINSNTEFSEAEIQAFEVELERDANLDIIAGNLQAAANKTFGEEIPANEELFRSVLQAQSSTELDQDYYIEASVILPIFFADTDDIAQPSDSASLQKTRGLIGSMGLKAKLIKAIVKTAVAVVRRFINNTDHGLHATIIEELSRRIHGDKIGSEIWSMMKKDSADAFEGEQRAGQFLLDALQASPVKPRVVLIGHSAGSIFVSNLLRNAEGGSFDVVFLAPAVTYRYFYDTIETHSHKIANFRMFTMTDANEREDELINGKSFIYPSSLLYLISGVLEKNESGTPDIDCPILGMERFFLPSYQYRPNDNDVLNSVREFLLNKPNALVWSKTGPEAPAGLASGSLDHGHFDDDEETRKSLQHIIKNGF